MSRRHLHALFERNRSLPCTSSRIPRVRLSHAASTTTESAADGFVERDVDAEETGAWRDKRFVDHLDGLFQPLQFPPELSRRLLTHGSHKDAARGHNARFSFIGNVYKAFSVTTNEIELFPPQKKRSTSTRSVSPPLPQVRPVRRLTRPRLRGHRRARAEHVRPR